MRIIVVGCGKVGATLAEQLNREGHDITVIDKDANRLRELTESIDVMGVEGNGASYNVQMEAGIESADMLIAVTNSDELNLLCCLIAKKASGCKTVARVRNPEYLQEINFIKEELGLSLTINPELAAATEMARLLRFPSAIKIDTFAKGRVELLKLRIPEGCVLHKMPISQIHVQLRCPVLVSIVERGEEVTIPNGDFELWEGDVISIIAAPARAAEFFRKIGIMSGKVRDVMVAGGGKISYYLAHQLLEHGMRVKIVERNAERCEVLSDLLPGADIIKGDATDKQLLSEEGIEQMDAFVALTDFDEENIMLSLYVGSKSNAKLITKVNRLTFEEVIVTLPLGSVIQPKFITADLILRYVRAMHNSYGSNVETLYKIAGGKAEALEFKVKERLPALVGAPLAKLRLKPNLLIGCIYHNGKAITPNGRDTIELGDSIVVVTTNMGLWNLQDIMRD